MDATLRLDRTAVEWRHVEGEVVALDLRDSMYLGINEAGAVLWPLLAEGTTRADLVDTLAERFALEPDRATADVDAFLTMLRERDLLVTDAPPAS